MYLRRRISILDCVFVQVSHIEDRDFVVWAVSEGVTFVQFVLVDFAGNTILDELLPGIAVREPDLVVFFQFGCRLIDVVADVSVGNNCRDGAGSCLKERELRSLGL